LSPNCLSLSSLFWRFVSYPSTNQAQPCLASETRQDWPCLGWYGNRLKIFLDCSFSFFIMKICSFLDFDVCLVLIPSQGANSEQIR
jgi:hypothetical protein